MIQQLRLNFLIAQQWSDDHRYHLMDKVEKQSCNALAVCRVRKIVAAATTSQEESGHARSVGKTVGGKVRAAF